jgi:hypothetical protein
VLACEHCCSCTQNTRNFFTNGTTVSVASRSTVLSAVSPSSLGTLNGLLSSVITGGWLGNVLVNLTGRPFVM